jgi:hypothetical protein
MTSFRFSPLVLISILSLTSRLWAEGDPERDLISTRYKAELGLIAPGDDFSYQSGWTAGWTGRCLLKWVDKRASGVIYLWDDELHDKELKIPITVDNLEEGLLRIESSPDSPRERVFSVVTYSEIPTDQIAPANPRNARSS